MLIDVDVNEIFKDEFFLDENIKNMEYGKALIVEKGRYSKSHIFDIAKKNGKNIRLKNDCNNIIIVCVSDRMEGQYEIVKNVIRTYGEISKSDLTSKTRCVDRFQRIEIVRQLQNECFIDVYKKHGTKKPITFIKWIAD